LIGLLCACAANAACTNIGTSTPATCGTFGSGQSCQFCVPFYTAADIAGGKTIWLMVFATIVNATGSTGTYTIVPTASSVIFPLEATQTFPTTANGGTFADAYSLRFIDINTPITFTVTQNGGPTSVTYSAQYAIGGGALNDDGSRIPIGAVSTNLFSANTMPNCAQCVLRDSVLLQMLAHEHVYIRADVTSSGGAVTIPMDYARMRNAAFFSVDDTKTFTTTSQSVRTCVFNQTCSIINAKYYVELTTKAGASSSGVGLTYTMAVGMFAGAAHHAVTFVTPLLIVAALTKTYFA